MQKDYYIKNGYHSDSIADACAIWYESTVKDFAIAIKNYILEN